LAKVFVTALKICTCSSLLFGNNGRGF